jgi:hypothetical protein
MWGTKCSLLSFIHKCKAGYMSYVTEHLTSEMTWIAVGIKMHLF